MQVRLLKRKFQRLPRARKRHFTYRGSSKIASALNGSGPLPDEQPSAGYMFVRAQPDILLGRGQAQTKHMLSL
jgi:hypothetical protein